MAGAGPENSKILSVQMLGGFHLSFSGVDVSPLPKKAGSLLAYLVFHRDKPQTRDLLAGQFWSEQSDEVARKRLSNNLWKIRKVFRSEVGEDLIRSDSSTVQFGSELKVFVDVEQYQQNYTNFKRFSAAQTKHEMVDSLTGLFQMYRGDLLAGYYDEWIAVDRQSFKEKHNSVVKQLIAVLKSVGDYESALSYSQLMVSGEPLEEYFRQESVRLYGLLGDVESASRQYQDYADLLSEELGASPSASMVELIDNLRRNSSGLKSQVDSGSRFVGRQVQKDGLLDLVDQLFAGNGGVGLVEGDAGVGKSRLLDEVVAGAEWRGATVVRSDINRFESMSPYQAVCQVLKPVLTGLRGEHTSELVDSVWLRQVAGLLPDLVLDSQQRQLSYTEQLKPEEELWRTNEAFVQLLLAQGKIGPTFLIVEDLQWCDKDSIAVFSQLARRLSNSRVLLCVSYRRDEAESSEKVWDLVTKLNSAERGSRFLLEPFTLAEMSELIAFESPLKKLAATDLQNLHLSTGGLPILVKDALRQPLAGDFSAVSGSSGSTDFDEQFLVRVDNLDSTTRKVLEVLSAASEELSSSEVAAVLGIERKDAIAALSAAVQCGFAVEGSAGCKVSNERFSELIYKSISKDRCSEIHVGLFNSLSATDRLSSDSAAFHAASGRLWRQAFDSHLAIADYAESICAYESLADHLSKADQVAEQGDLDSSLRVQVLFRLEVSFEYLGRVDDQKQTLAKLAELCTRRVDCLRLKQRESWFLALSDELEQAMKMAESCIEEAERTDFDMGELWITAGSAALWSGNSQKAIDSFTKAVEAKEASQDSSLFAQIMLGKSYIERQDINVGLKYLNQALAEAGLVGDVRARVEALSHLAVAHMASSKASEATEVLSEAISLSRKIAYRHGEALGMVNLASLYVTLGKGGKALELFESAAELFASIQSARGEAFVMANSAELNHKLLGKDDLAKSQATASAIYFRSVNDQAHECVCLNTLCNIDRRHGRRRFARRRLKEMLRKAKESEDKLIEATAFRSLSLLELDNCRFELALEYAESALRLVNSISFEPFLANTLALKARAVSKLGDSALARELVTLASRSVQPGSEDAAFTHWLCADVLVDCDDLDGAKGQISKAYETVLSNLDDIHQSDAFDRAWLDVPENKIIRDSYEQYFRRVCVERLPGLGVPLGRKLLESDLVPVRWTVSAPEDFGVELERARRQKRIVRLCEEAAHQGAVPRIGDLSKCLGVSERTVKRDLVELRNSDISVKTRGSAEIS